MRLPALVFASLLLVSASSGLRAQEEDVTRRAYTFFGDDLTIEVNASMPGVLQLVRGGRGRIEVAGRGDDAVLISAPPRPPGSPLRLDAVGGTHVTWIVVVPENVRVQIQTPAQSHVTPASPEAAATYRWNGEQSSSANERSPMFRAGLVPTFFDPGEISGIRIPDISAVRRISVRIEGNEFGVAASRAVTLRRNAQEGLEILLPEDATDADIVVHIPAGTTDLLLLAGELEILRLAGGAAGALCTPVTVQTLAGGVRVFDFTPIRGTLRCGT